MDQYKMQVLKIGESRVDFGILWHWIKNQEDGEYEITIRKINDKDDGK